MAYQSGLFLNPNRIRFLELAWQVIHMGWAVFCFMAFLYAAGYGFPINSKCTNWLVYDDSDMTDAPLGRVFPLPLELVAYIRQLGLHNLVRGNEYSPEHAEALLGWVAQTDWSASSRYWWYDYEEDSFSPIPRNPYRKDDRKVYTNRVILPASAASSNVMNIPRSASYYPLSIGFSSRFLGANSPPSAFP